MGFCNALLLHICHFSVRSAKIEFTYYLHLFFACAQAACQAAAAFCKEKGKNISKLAMQYSLSNKDISSILVGMNSVRQVMTYHCSYRCNFFCVWIASYMNQTFQFPWISFSNIMPKPSCLSCLENPYHEVHEHPIPLCYLLWTWHCEA